MLRPEQITVAQNGGDGVFATVAEINFCGPISDVRITLGDAFTFRIDIPSRETLSAGDRVTIGVAGAAHLFR